MSASVIAETPVRQTLLLRQRMQRAIDDEMAERIAVHQNRIARVKAARSRMMALNQPAAEPLVLLAQGDSWFDYPLDGNNLTLSDTDIIAQLRGLGDVNPVIINIAHHGATSTDEMGLPRQQRMLDLLQDPANWLARGKPDAILFSAGGNDIAGDQFCIVLDYSDNSANGLDEQRYNKALGAVEASYRDLFEFRDRYAQGVPIFGHCYDFPLPTGRHPLCVGPWLLPSLQFAGWGHDQGAAICKRALEGFKAMLTGLASDASNLFFLVDTQNTFRPEDWANELHPYPAGFRKLAEKFVIALRQNGFQGRI